MGMRTGLSTSRRASLGCSSLTGTGDNYTLVRVVITSLTGTGDNYTLVRVAVTSLTGTGNNYTRVRVVISSMQPVCSHRLALTGWLSHTKFEYGKYNDVFQRVCDK